MNTHISHVADPRYDPARRHSKLGVPAASLRDVLGSAPIEVSGLHFHTNADSIDLSELEENVQALAVSMPDSRRFDWVNFGGGYLFEEVSNLDLLRRSIALAKSTIASEVFIEPGACFVRSAAQLVTSVVDIFNRSGLHIAVLDTSVNHLPEVLEFGYRPEVRESSSEGGHEYLLAGSTCLSGDEFGRYSFDTPLTVGDTISFIDAGAYTQAKSHRFNGINLPSVWMTDGGENHNLRQLFDYLTYREYWMPNV